MKDLLVRRSVAGTAPCQTDARGAPIAADTFLQVPQHASGVRRTEINIAFERATHADRKSRKRTLDVEAKMHPVIPDSQKANEIVNCVSHIRFACQKHRQDA